MAGLIINDPYGGGQELISSGRSQIPLRETYSTDPRALSAQYSDRLKNVNQLVDSLSSLTKTVGSIEEQNRKLEADNAEAYVADVYGKLNSTDPIDKQLATLRPDLNPWTRAAMSQIIARQQAQTTAQGVIENMPMEARQTPEATQAYFDEFYKKESQRIAGQPFYTAPYLGALRDSFSKRSGALSTERTTVMTQAMREDGRTQQYNAMEGLIKNGQLPVDPTKAPNPEEASEVVAFAQKVGVSPLNVAMLLQTQQAQTTPDQFGATPQQVPIQQRLADLERALVAKGVKPGASFADMYKAVNPNGNAQEDVKTAFPKAAQFLGLPMDERSTTVGGRTGINVVGDIVDRTKSVDDFTRQRWAGFGPLQKVEGFVVHHTGGRGTVEGVIETFKQRNFPVHYIIDREGRVHQVLADNQRSQHIKNSRINNLSNANSIGVEIIARDDKDVTPAQVAAARKLIATKAQEHGFGPNAVFGHGEVNPGHKMPEEGMSVVRAIRERGFDMSDVANAPVDFKNDIYRRALSIGMPDHLARLAAAQASLESADGKSSLATRSNNLFGIKADPSWRGESVTSNTEEEVNGQRIRVDQKFRKYASTDDSLKDWWDKIQKNYPKTAGATTFEEAVAGLKQGTQGAYATASNYGEIVTQRSQGIQSAPAPDPKDPSNAPISPEAYQLRQVFFNVDGVQDKTHPLYSRTQRKQDAIANVKQIAMQSLNPDLLTAIPTSILTPTEREDLNNWSLAIRKEQQAQETAAWTQRARAQQLAVEQANRTVNEHLIKLQQGQDLNTDQRAKLMLDLNNIDPKLADEFGEKYNKIKNGKMDPRMESEIYRDLEQQLWNTVNNGGDPTTVPLNRQTDPELSMKLGTLARQLAKDGGELSQSIYKDLYSKNMAAIYGMIGEGPAMRINNTGVWSFMYTSFNRFLLEEVGKFKAQTGVNNITADDQRSMIFNNALKRVIQAYPQEVGADGDATRQKILNDGKVEPGSPGTPQGDLERKRTEEAVKGYKFGQQ